MGDSDCQGMSKAMLLLTALGRIILCLSQFLVLIPTRVPGLPQSEAKQKSQARLYSVPILQQEGQQTTGSLACLLTERAGELVPLYGVRVVGCVKGMEEWLPACPPPWVMLCAGAMHDNLLSAPSSSEVVVEILVFCIFFCHDLPQLCMHAFF